MGEMELKPCPFCGGEARHHDIGNAHTKSRATKIWCSSCFFSKKVGAIRQSLDWTREHAIKAWNTRVSPDPSATMKEVVEVLEFAGTYIGMQAGSDPDAFPYLERVRALLAKLGRG